MLFRGIPTTKNVMKMTNFLGKSDIFRKGPTTRNRQLDNAASVSEWDSPHVNYTNFENTPFYMKNGKLRSYQLAGLNWLINIYHSRVNGILADEMGLGKTIQTIAFLGYLKHYELFSRPHLLVVPKSTLNNWKTELEKWCPTLKTIVYHGEIEERAEMSLYMKNNRNNFDICLSNYEIVMAEQKMLMRLKWHYIIIDEAQRIKNDQSKLSILVRKIKSKRRLLITGTPIQNNMHELWALLNFLMPKVFSNAEDFESWFSHKGNDQDQDDENKLLKRLHAILDPFLLRRVKSEVEKELLPKKRIDLYIGMSELQKKWYERILLKDISILQGESTSKSGLSNILMQLRKCCNHPYLFPGAETEKGNGHHLIESSGKLKVLDKLLYKLKENGSRVLIFCTMTNMLDILDDYLFWRGFKSTRIDGSTSHALRVERIDEFNAPDSDLFTFIISTRAGGLGINLATADTVIMYEYPSSLIERVSNDWNPQVDLQAEDRAHRIGQKKQVVIYRFITENSVEESIIERAHTKLKIDRMIIQEGLVKKSKRPEKEELLQIIRHGAIEALQENKSLEDDFDQMFEKSAKKQQALEEKYKDMALSELTQFQNDGVLAYEWNGNDFQKLAESNRSTKTFYSSTGRPKRKAAATPLIELSSSPKIAERSENVELVETPNESYVNTSCSSKSIESNLPVKRKKLEENTNPMISIIDPDSKNSFCNVPVFDRSRSVCFGVIYTPVTLAEGVTFSPRTHKVGLHIVRLKNAQYGYFRPNSQEPVAYPSKEFSQVLELFTKSIKLTCCLQISNSGSDITVTGANLVYGHILAGIAFAKKTGLPYFPPTGFQPVLPYRNINDALLKMCDGGNKPGETVKDAQSNGAQKSSLPDEIQRISLPSVETILRKSPVSAPELSAVLPVTAPSNPSIDNTETNKANGLSKSSSSTSINKSNQAELLNPKPANGGSIANVARRLGPLSRFDPETAVCYGKINFPIVLNKIASFLSSETEIAVLLVPSQDPHNNASYFIRENSSEILAYLDVNIMKRLNNFSKCIKCSYFLNPKQSLVTCLVYGSRDVGIIFATFFNFSLQPPSDFVIRFPYYDVQMVALEQRKANGNSNHEKVEPTPIQGPFEMKIPNLIPKRSLLQEPVTVQPYLHHLKINSKGESNSFMPNPILKEQEFNLEEEIVCFGSIIAYMTVLHFENIDRKILQIGSVRVQCRFRTNSALSVFTYEHNKYIGDINPAASYAIRQSVDDKETNGVFQLIPGEIPRVWLNIIGKRKRQDEYGKFFLSQGFPLCKPIYETRYPYVDPYALMRASNIL